MRHALRRTFAAAALLAAQCLATALACSCVPPGSPQQEAARSVTTFTGTVVAIQTVSPPPVRPRGLLDALIDDIRSLLAGKAIRAPASFEPYQVVTFRVDRTFRGRHAAVRRVNAGETNSTCSFRFAQGGHYVVYAFDRQGRLAAGECSRTALSSDPRAGYRELAGGGLR